jgi:hypothetical protein
MTKDVGHDTGEPSSEEEESVPVRTQKVMLSWEEGSNTPCHTGILHYILTCGSASRLVGANSGRNFVFFELFQTRGN